MFPVDKQKKKNLRCGAPLVRDWCVYPGSVVMELDLCSGTKASRGMRASQKIIGVQYALMQVAMTRWPVGQFMSVRRNLPRYKTGSEPVLEYIPRFPGPGRGYDKGVGQSERRDREPGQKTWKKADGGRGLMITI